MVADHNVAAHVSQNQKKGAGANFNIRTEVAIALKDSNVRKINRCAPRFSAHGPLVPLDVGFPGVGMFSDSNDGKTDLTRFVASERFRIFTIFLKQGQA
jgi:hypothetical protein